MSQYVKKYEGTKNFHNFSRKMPPNDKSANRYIIKMEVELLDREELSKLQNTELKHEYFVIKFHGQSFIYHQIRKMVGALIQAFQDEVGDSILENSFYLNKVPVWLAPGEGLLLDKLDYSSYNSRADVPEKIELTEEEEAIRVKFKKENLMKKILEFEEKEKVFTDWLHVVMEHEDGDFKNSHY